MIKVKDVDNMKDFVNKVNDRNDELIPSISTMNKNSSGQIGLCEQRCGVRPTVRQSTTL